MDSGTVVSIAAILMTVFLFVIGLSIKSFQNRYASDQRMAETHRIDLKESVNRVEQDIRGAHQRMDNISTAVTRQWAETIEEVARKEGRMQAQISDADKHISVLKARCDATHQKRTED